MRKYLCLLTGLLPLLASAQLVMNNNFYVVLDNGSQANPTTLVLTNGGTSGIINNGSGWIVSENEFNQVQWNIGTATGQYTVPFGYSTAQYLPLTLNISSGGTGIGVIKFSTYHTPSLNSSAEPSDVTNLTPFILPGSPSNSDNSYNIADRFYIIDANTGYSVLPTPGNITLSYISGTGSTEVGASNTLTESRLMAQRFNSNTNTWSDWFGEGCTDAIFGNVGTVQTGPLTSANWFRSWSLWDQTMTLPLQISGTNLTCNGDNSGTATVTVYGGLTPYTYLWTTSPNQTTNPATGMSAGTYTVSVHDNTGCYSTISITLTQPASALDITMSSHTDVSCHGGTGDATANAATGGTLPYTYLWNDAINQTTVNATGLTAGSYTITATDNNGCTATAGVTITQPAVSLNVLALPINIQCFGGTGGATAVGVVGGTSPYTYLWNDANSQTAVNATGLSIGSYTVTVTDNHACTATAAATVTQPTVLGVTIASQSNVLCNGGVGSCTANAATGGTLPYIYQWSDASSQTSLTATGLSAGSYTVFATDNHGCSATTSATITQPGSALDITMASSTNSGACTPNGSATANAATGGTSPYTYSWTPGGGSNLTASGLSGGTYTIVATDNNGCTATASAVITQPAGVVITIASQSNALCHGGTGSATANAATGGTAPYTYLWNDASSQTSLNATGLIAGSYTITATDNLGCFTNAFVTITQPGVLSAAPTAPGIACNGGTVTASSGATGGTTPYTYQWNDASSQTTDPATGLSAGSYTVSIMDNNGCSATGAVTVTEPTALWANTSFTAASCSLPNGSTTASGTGGTSPYTYAWSPGGNTNGTATGLSAGTYTVDVTDNNGCAFSATVTVTQPFHVRDSIASSTNISCNGGANGSATVGVKYGITPYTYLWNDANSQTTLTATGLSAGTYSITVTSNTGCPATASVTITQPAAALDITMASHSNVLCNGGTGDATANSATGGTSPYTYIWNDASSQTSINATGLIAGSYTITATDNHGCTATTSVTITQPASALDITMASSTNSGACTPNGSATANAATGGTSPYTYSWTPGGGSNLTASGLSGGTYTIVATDNNGCTATASAIITQPTGVVITIASQSNVQCHGGTGSATANAAIGGSAPYTYLWNDASSQTSLNATGLTAGSYTITATDNLGCFTNAFVTISQPGALSASPTALNIACNGGTVTASSGISGGTSPYTYLWNDANSQTSVNATGLSAGSYTITATDNHGCTASALVTITQPSILVITLASQSNVLCNGGIGNATANTATGGTSPYTYLWNDANSQTTVNATGLIAGSYTIAATDNHGCTATASVSITQPASALDITMASLSNILCNGATGIATANTATGGTLPYTYLWNDANSQTTVNATGLIAGSYTITATDNNGCSATTSATITQPASALNITIASSTNSGGCNPSGNVTANTATGGTSPYTYNWTPSGGTGLIASGLSGGTYTITATDNNGCASTASATITQPAGVSINIASQSNVLCNGGTGSATANAATGGTAPYTYLWNDASSQTLLNATGLIAGSYTITATDNLGCNGVAFVTITQPAVITTTHDSVNDNGTCNGLAAITASGGTVPYTYLWTTGSQTTDTIKNQCGGAAYCCTITDNNGCTASTCVTVKLSTGVNKLKVENGELNIYPNPNTGQYTVTGLVKGQVVELYNYLGQKLSSVMADDATMHFDITTMANGIYLVRILNKDGSLVTQKKIVKTQ